MEPHASPSEVAAGTVADRGGRGRGGGRRPRRPSLPERALQEERLSAASPDRDLCVRCGLFSAGCKTPWMRPFVPKGWTRRLLLVGEAPGEDEDTRSGRPFSGRAGRLLRRLYRAAGFDDVDVALTNAIRCRPPGNATPTMSQIRACRGFLLRTLRVLRPPLVVALGTTATRALTNDGDLSVTAARGRRLEVPGLTLWDPPPLVYATYHPAAVLHGATHLESRIVDDLRRPAFPALEYPEDRPPDVLAPVGAALGVDTEYDPEGRLLTVGLAEEGCAAAFEDPRQVDEYLRPSRRVWLVGHGIAGDIHKLVEHGCPVQDEHVSGERVLDSLLLSRMFDENEESYGVEDLLLARYHVAPWKHETEAYNWVVEEGENGRKRRVYRVDARRWPEELRRKRCRLDAWAALQNAKDFVALLRGRKGKDPRGWDLVEFTHRVASTIARLELSGMVVDRARLSALGRELEAAMLAAEDQLVKAAVAAGMTGEEFAPSNDRHLRELLYSRLGLPVREYTPKDGLPSVGKSALVQLRGEHPVVELLLAYNAAEKLYSTNIEGLRPFLLPAGVLDTPSGQVPIDLLPIRLNPLGARTGRRSSSDPNVQNWTKKIRRIVRSRHPRGLVGYGDYSKLEPIVLGWIAREPFLLEVFGSPEGGGYVVIAREMWGYEVQEGTPEYRAAKSIVLGVHYNMGADKMAHQLWILGVRFSADYRTHLGTTDRLRRKYLALIPRVVRYMDQQEKQVLARGYVVSPTGRVRHLPCPDGRDTKGFGHILNQAINFPVQSTAADITGAAMVDIERGLLEDHGLSYGEYLRLLLDAKKSLTTGGKHGILWDDKKMASLYPLSLLLHEVHDELVFDLHPDYARRDTERVVETMRAVPTFRRLVPEWRGLRLNVNWAATPYWHGTADDA